MARLLLLCPCHPGFKRIHDELDAKGIKTCDIFSPSHRFGQWLRKRPAAAIIKGMYMSHSGHSQGLSLEEIGSRFQQSVNENRWDSDFYCGLLSL